MGFLAGTQFVFDLGPTSLPFSERVRLKDEIIRLGGTVSYLVTKKTNYVVATPDRAQEHKAKEAAKHGAAVVGVAFVWDCVERGTLLPPAPYLLAKDVASEAFAEGKIGAKRPQQDGPSSSLIRASKLARTRPDPNVLARARSWAPDSPKAPPFPPFTVVAHAAYVRPSQNVKKQGASSGIDFLVYELHAAHTDSTEKGRNGQAIRYRVHSHSGEMDSKGHVHTPQASVQYFDSCEDALAVFALRCDLPPAMQPPYTQTEKLQPAMGSEALQCHLRQGGILPSSSQVMRLVRYIYAEACRALSLVLAVDPKTITQKQMEKADGTLLAIRRDLEGTETVRGPRPDISTLSASFYRAIPHQSPQPLTTLSLVAQKIDLLQLLRDVHSVEETSRGNQLELPCDIVPLERDSTEFESVVRRLEMTPAGQPTHYKVHTIYRVQRQGEAQRYASALARICSTTTSANESMLLHSSHVKNFVGILSRGLLLPKLVVEEMGGQRTDMGMLGSGLYFTDDPTETSKYAHPGRPLDCDEGSGVCGPRLAAVCSVALGHSKYYHVHATDLTKCPEGYHSVHGVKTSASQPTPFEADEYVIYDTAQQCMQYLVEFNLPGDDTVPQTVHAEDSVTQLPTSSDVAAMLLDGSLSDDACASSTSELQSAQADIVNAPSQLKPQPVGLVCGDAVVPLEEVHVRGRIVDMVSEVVVMQHYHNKTSMPLEAKYVFPLDDSSAVYGFEAFINGKHITGKVKKKEEAHREYVQAISQGHGAYLMDQEAPDVFTVSVGNLPPGAHVLIMITYVAELSVEGSRLVFRLPLNSVAPSKQQSALSHGPDWDPHAMGIEEVQAGPGPTGLSVEVGLEMASVIRNVSCASHSLAVKQTDTMATVQMRTPIETPTDDFVLYIELAEIHRPHLWIEEDPDLGFLDPRACMVAFYPEFAFEPDPNTTVTLLLDCSSSMGGRHWGSTRALVLQLLHSLPPATSCNLLFFASTWHSVLPVAKPLTPATLAKLTSALASIRPDGGGSELLAPLQALMLLRDPHSTDQPLHSVLVLTDGHITQENEVLGWLGGRDSGLRVFTCGVEGSDGRNIHMLRAMARIGGGYCEIFDTQRKSRWPGQIDRQMAKVFQPGLTDISIEWVQHNDKGPTLLAPAHIPTVFQGTRLLAFAFVESHQANLHATINGVKVTTTVATSPYSARKGKLLHVLAARAFIRDWDDGGYLAADRTEHALWIERMEEGIVELSIRYGLVTRLTSFVAVEHRDEDELPPDGHFSIDEIVERVVVDRLPELGWTEQVLPHLEPKAHTYDEHILDGGDRKEVGETSYQDDTLDSGHEGGDEKAGMEMAKGEAKPQQETEEEVEECMSRLQDAGLEDDVHRKDALSCTQISKLAEEHRMMEMEFERIMAGMGRIVAQSERTPQKDAVTLPPPPLPCPPSPAPQSVPVDMLARPGGPMRPAANLQMSAAMTPPPADTCMADDMKSEEVTQAQELRREERQRLLESLEKSTENPFVGRFQKTSKRAPQDDAATLPPPPPPCPPPPAPLSAPVDMLARPGGPMRPTANLQMSSAMVPPPPASRSHAFGPPPPALTPQAVMAKAPPPPPRLFGAASGGGGMGPGPSVIGIPPPPQVLPMPPAPPTTSFSFGGGPSGPPGASLFGQSRFGTPPEPNIQPAGARSVSADLAQFQPSSGGFSFASAPPLKGGPSQVQPPSIAAFGATSQISSSQMAGFGFSADTPTPPPSLREGAFGIPSPSTAPVSVSADYGGPSGLGYGGKSTTPLLAENSVRGYEEGEGFSQQTERLEKEASDFAHRRGISKRTSRWDQADGLSVCASAASASAMILPPAKAPEASPAPDTSEDLDLDDIFKDATTEDVQQQRMGGVKKKKRKPPPPEGTEARKDTVLSRFDTAASNDWSHWGPLLLAVDMVPEPSAIGRLVPDDVMATVEAVLLEAGLRSLGPAAHRDVLFLVLLLLLFDWWARLGLLSTSGPLPHSVLGKYEVVGADTCGQPVGELRARVDWLVATARTLESKYPGLVRLLGLGATWADVTKHVIGRGWGQTDGDQQWMSLNDL